MRLLFGSHRYFPVPGGTERLVQTIAEGAAARGHDVHVVTQCEPSVPDEEVVAGVHVHRLRVVQFPFARWPRGYLRFLRHSGADLFHLYGNRIWCVDAYLPWARRFRWPQVLTGLGFYQYAMHPRWWDRTYFERYFPRRVRGFDRYLACTEFEARQLTGWGFPAEKVEHIPLGIDLTEFDRPIDGVSDTRASWNVRAPLVGVYAGGFFENKRVDRLVEAVARTRGRWALVAIGRDIPDSPCSEANVRALAARLGVELVTPGVMPRVDILRSLQAADAVLLGSEYEGFGLTLLESMAAGRPFVAFDAGAAQELAETGAGIVVRSPEEMGAALIDLEDGTRRQRIGEAGRSAVRRYSQSVMVERHLALYDRLLRERTGPPGP